MLPFTIRVFLTSVAFLLVSSCSSSSTDVASTDVSNNSSAQEASNQAVSLSSDVFKGTWVTECQPDEIVPNYFAQYSFMFDGSTAVQLKRSFDDATCGTMTDYSYRVGSIEFEGTLVESNFGATSTVIEFYDNVNEDGVVTESFSDIIYRTENQLFFGVADQGIGEMSKPTALNYARPFVLNGPADIASLDLLELTYLVDILVEWLLGQSEQAIQQTSNLLLDVNVSIAGSEDLFIPMRLTGGLWVGQFQFNEKAKPTISVTWSALVDGGQVIVLGDLQKSIAAVGPLQTEVRIKSADYDLSHDADGDGVSNIFELENGTDPLDSSSR